jgi:hypothetical protein
MAERERLIDRIRKAQALAADQAGTPEGETAARIARELMTAHAIVEAELGVARDTMEERVFDVGHKATWLRRLATHVAEHCECFSTYTPGTSRVQLHGRQSDVEVAIYLYETIRTQVESALERQLQDIAARAHRQGYTLNSGRCRSYRDRFRHSATTAVAQRLVEMRRQQQATDPAGTALMSLRGSEAERWAKEHRHVKASRTHVPDGVLAGYEAGQAVQIVPGVNPAGADAPAHQLGGTQ